MSLFDSLPLLGSLQAAILLGYLLLRRRINFGRTAVEVVLLVALALGLFEVSGGGHRLGFGLWGAMPWIIATPAAICYGY
jgi:adhesin transport system membrane fusion protein